MIVNIKGQNGLVRDCSSGAILNTNKADYQNYLSLKAKQQKEKELADKQKEEIDILKSEIADIKELLKTIVTSIKE